MSQSIVIIRVARSVEGLTIHYYMIMESTDHRVHRAPAPCAVLKSGVRGEKTTPKKMASVVQRPNGRPGRPACASGTGRPEVHHTDHRILTVHRI